MNLTEQWIRYLNELNKADPVWLKMLLEFRPQCNEAIQDHPNLPVVLTPFGADAGFLGVLNGFLKQNSQTWVCYLLHDETGQIQGFAPSTSPCDTDC